MARMMLAAAAGGCCLAQPPAQAADDYQLGRGLDLGPVNIAGYTNLVAGFPEQAPRSLALDDLSLFVSAHLGRFFNPFTETELEGLSLLKSGGEIPDRDANFTIERLYNDSYLTDSVTLRLGQMLTPVGEWNQIHAAPLVLTTVRPAVTSRNYSEYATGASLLYSDPYLRLPDLQVYWQPDGELYRHPNSIRQFKSIEGAHAAVPLSLLDQVGFSFQHARELSGADQSLFGIDFHYTIGSVALQGEATVTPISNNPAVHFRDTEWGGYLAATYSLTNQWSLYSWYENFADRSLPSIAQDVLFGFAYRPQPPIVFRLEYLQNFGGQPVNPTGLFAGWAVLF
jgi:hypothetical protein